MAVEMKSEKGHFCNSIRDYLKMELADIKGEIQQKLSKVITDLKTTTDRVGEVKPTLKSGALTSGNCGPTT